MQNANISKICTLFVDLIELSEILIWFHLFKVRRCLIDSLRYFRIRIDFWLNNNLHELRSFENWLQDFIIFLMANIFIVWGLSETIINGIRVFIVANIVCGYLNLARMHVSVINITFCRLWKLRFSLIVRFLVSMRKKWL
jgi:hypothetical protein